MPQPPYFNLFKIYNSVAAFPITQHTEHSAGVDMRMSDKYSSPTAYAGDL